MKAKKTEKKIQILSTKKRGPKPRPENLENHYLEKLQTNFQKILKSFAKHVISEYKSKLK